MKNLRKIVVMALSIFMTVGLAACGNGESNNGGTELMFWAAPNAEQLAFWTNLAEEYNATEPEYTIKVQQMPETPSSEAGIQNAIASGEAPVASENIQRGFATHLAANEAIIPLQDNEIFKEIIAERDMKGTISGWEIEGSQYVLPFFSNPVLNAWRVDELKALGITEMPKTYDDFYAVADKIAARGTDQYVLTNEKIQKPADWWERWYDFFNYYYAEADGAPFIENEKLVADEKAAISVLTFLQTLNNKERGLLTSPADTAFGDTLALSQSIGPWILPDMAKKFPELKSPENFDFALPPTSKGTNKYTFADTKGMVFYRGSTDEQIDGMLKFFQFALTEDNDLAFMEKTQLIPARDDLGTNARFVEFFDNNPAIKRYAEVVGDAIPPMSSAKMQEIQEIMGQHMQKLVSNDNPVSPEDTWENMKAEIENLLGA